MVFCPCCGHELPVMLKDGSASCLHCSRVFDTSPFYKMLSAAWSVKRDTSITLKSLQDYGFTEEEALFAYTFIAENAYSIQEFEKFLKQLGVSRNILA